MSMLTILYLTSLVLAFADAKLPNPPPPGTYRAAVLEHAVQLPGRIACSRWEALTQMMANLGVYRHFAAKAGTQNTDILVFPEDGLYGFTLRVRSAISWYLEPIPDPRHIKWVPCDEPHRFVRSEVQVYLSCIAKSNSVYVVANIGDMQACGWGDPNCPPDGQYQYNTNVVYDRQGKFIARYHKQNLFQEPQFDRPTHPEHVYFDTKFGRFGVMTCFDAVFHEPAISLVEEHKVTNIVFPTAWWDAFPYFVAIGYQWSFSVLHGVNFLAANLRIPTWGIYGSGMFSPDGKGIYYHDRVYHGSKLMIADISKISAANKTKHWNTNTCNRRPFDFGKNEMKHLTPTEFKSTTYHDWFDYVTLRKHSGQVTVCQNGFCCYLDYEKQATLERYVFGVFDGIHRHIGPYYIQVCVLLKCATMDPLHCGKPIYTAGTHFKRFHMKGDFSTPYVYPQILLTNNMHLELPPAGSWQYGPKGLRGQVGTKPLLTASLFGRVFHKDGVGRT